MYSKKNNKSGDFSSSSSSLINSNSNVNIHVESQEQIKIEQVESSSVKNSNSLASSDSPLSSSSSSSVTSSPTNNRQNAAHVHEKNTNLDTNIKTNINVSVNHNNSMSAGSSRNSSSNLSNIQTESTISTQTAHIPTTYYYPYLHPPAHSAPPNAYSTQIDLNSATNWPQAMAAAAMAMAAAVNDPISMAAYISTYHPNELPPNYDTVSFGFQPAAFSYGYSNTGTVDYSMGTVPPQTNTGVALPQQPHRLPTSQVWTGAPNTSPGLAIHSSQNDSMNNQTPNSNTQSIHQPNTKWMPFIQDPSLLVVPQNSAPSTAQFSDLINPHLLGIYQQQGVYRYPSTTNHHVHNSHYNHHHKQHSQYSRQHHSNISNGHNFFQQQYNNTSKNNNYMLNNNNEHVSVCEQKKLENEFNKLSLYSDSNGRTNTNKTRSSSYKYLNKNQKYQNNLKKNYNSYNSNSNVNNSNDKGENSASQNSVDYTKNSSVYTKDSNIMNLNIENLNENGQMSSSKSENGGSSGITWASIVSIQNKSQQPANQPSALLSITTSSNSTLSSSSTTPSHSSLQQQHGSTQNFQYNPHNNFQRQHNNFKNNFNKPDYSSYKIMDDNLLTTKKYSNNYSNKTNINTNDFQEYQQHLEFSLNNGAFPSIAENYKNGTYDSNSKIRKSLISDENININNNTNANNKFLSKNYKKQQLYNNYQKHQQRQFGLNPIQSQTQITNYLGNSDAINADSANSFDQIDLNSYRLQNSASNDTNSTDLSNRTNKNTTQSRVIKNRSFKNHQNDDNLSEENKNGYYKRHHHPTQPTISSFMTHLEKSLFADSKNKNTYRSVNNNNNNNTSANIDKNDFQVNIQLKPQQIDLKNYNPKEFNTSPKAARFFVIKSYSEDDVYRSIKYNIWCSTEHGNRRLDLAYSKGDSFVPVYLFFSVNGSGHFCGMAEMISHVDYDRKIDLWSQDKWRGCFQINWIYVKDVPNSLLRNIKLENNDNKPVTNSRDTQEIPFDKGKQVLKVFHTYNHSSSIFDDFDHYEKRQDEDKILKSSSNMDNQFIINKEEINNKNVAINTSANSGIEFLQDTQPDKRNDPLEKNQHHQNKYKQIIMT